MTTKKKTTKLKKPTPKVAPKREKSQGPSLLEFNALKTTVSTLAADLEKTSKRIADMIETINGRFVGVAVALREASESTARMNAALAEIDKLGALAKNLTLQIEPAPARPAQQIGIVPITATHEPMPPTGTFQVVVSSGSGELPFDAKLEGVRTAQAEVTP